MWKTRQFDDILLQQCNAVYSQNRIERWTKGCILPFPKKGDLGLAKNYRGITLTSIAAKIYNALLRNHIEPKIDNILRKNQNGFRRNRSTTSQILTIRRILEGVRAKNLPATLLFVDFTKAFDSIHWGKMEQILLAYGLPKETVAAIMILYRNTKVKVRSPDGDTEYFDIVARVLQGDTLAPIDRLSIIWKSDLTDKMKRSFFQAAVVSILLYGCTTWTLTKWLEKKLDWNYTRILRAVLNKSWRQHPTRHQLYGHLPPIMKTIQVRRTRHAGHCWRSKDELISEVLLWTPTYGHAKAGRPVRAYIQQLCEDTGCNPEDLSEAMSNREKWRERVRDIHAGGTTWWWWWWWHDM